MNVLERRKKVGDVCCNGLRMRHRNEVAGAADPNTAVGTTVCAQGGNFIAQFRRTNVVVNTGNGQ